MRIFFTRAVLVCFCLSFLTSGCRRKSLAGGSSNLEEDVSKFTAAESVTKPTPPADTAPAAPAPAQEMKAAVQAYKEGQFEDAVTRLQSLRAKSGMTGPQYMALNDAIAKVMTELSGLAAKGDQRAIQALKQYEKMQTGQR